MKERPILFSAPMVRALLAGRKTQTRRLVSPRHLVKWPPPSDLDARWTHNGSAFVLREERVVHSFPFPCPYGVPGDRLWVKETWRPQHEHQHTPITEIPENVDIHYAASLSEYDRKEKGPWKPSIFMRRWMSRVFVKVEEIRVQRLQDISEEDALAEGIEAVAPNNGWSVFCEDGGAAWWGSDVGPPVRGERGVRDFVEQPAFGRTAVEGFWRLWDDINGGRDPGGNPWVWAVSFRVVP